MMEKVDDWKVNSESKQMKWNQIPEIKRNEMEIDK